MPEQNQLPLDIISKALWARIQSYTFDMALEKELFPEISKHNGRNISEVALYLNMSEMSARIILQYLCAQQILIYDDEGLFKNSPAIEHLLLDKAYTESLASFSSYDYQTFKNKLYTPSPQPWYAIREKQNSIDDNEGIDFSFFNLDHQHYWRIEKGIELAGQFNFGAYHNLLDIGGASGGWGIGITKKYPHLNYTLFDLPEVCIIARKILSEEKSGASYNVAEGDIFNHPNFPPNTDIILIANVLHDWNVADMKVILGNIFSAFEKITVLISELFINDDWNGPLLNMVQSILVLGQDNESGWQPSYSEMCSVLEEVGFKIDKTDANLIICSK
jgi:hypothetical protein